MTTTSADEKDGAKPAPGVILDPDEADRFAALIKPAWEDEDGAVQASSTATPGSAAASAASARTSDEGRPTAIDPIPTVEVGDTLPIDGPPLIDTDALVASVEPTEPKSKGPPPAPSARPDSAAAGHPRPGSTRMGIGNDVEVAAKAAALAEAERSAAAPAGATRMGIGDASELAAAGRVELAASAQPVEPDEDLIATQARPVASVPPSASAPPQPPRPAAGAVAARASAPSASRVSEDDPISLPMNRGTRGGGSMGVGIGIGLGIAAVAGLAIFFIVGGGDEKTAPAPAATTAAAAAPPKEPEVKPPPIPAEEPAPSNPAKADPPKEEPKVDPPKEEPKAEAPKQEPPKEEPKPPSGGSKPPSGGSKPPGSPPAGGTKPKGGIIRDAPF